MAIANTFQARARDKLIGWIGRQLRASREIASGIHMDEAGPSVERFTRELCASHAQAMRKGTRKVVLPGTRECPAGSYVLSCSTLKCDAAS